MATSFRGTAKDRSHFRNAHADRFAKRLTQAVSYCTLVRNPTV